VAPIKKFSLHFSFFISKPETGQPEMAQRPEVTLTTWCRWDETTPAWCRRGWRRSGRGCLRTRSPARRPTSRARSAWTRYPSTRPWAWWSLGTASWCHDTWWRRCCPAFLKLFLPVEDTRFFFVQVVILEQTLLRLTWIN